MSIFDSTKELRELTPERFMQYKDQENIYPNIIKDSGQKKWKVLKEFGEALFKLNGDKDIEFKEGSGLLERAFRYSARGFSFEDEIFQGNSPPEVFAQLTVYGLQAMKEYIKKYHQEPYETESVFVQCRMKLMNNRERGDADDFVDFSKM